MCGHARQTAVWRPWPGGCYNDRVLLLELIVTLLLLAICSFAPGFVFVRRFAVERIGKAMRIDRAFVDPAMAGGVVCVCPGSLAADGRRLRHRGDLLRGGDCRAPRRGFAFPDTARAARSERVRLFIGVDAAHPLHRAGVHRSILERGLAGAFPTHALLPASLSHEHADIPQLHFDGASADDERAGRPVPGCDGRPLRNISNSSSRSSIYCCFCPAAWRFRWWRGYAG